MILGNVGPIGSGSDLPPIEAEGGKSKKVSKQSGPNLGAIFATQARNAETVMSVMNNGGNSPIARFVGSLLRNLSPKDKERLLGEIARRDPKLFPAGLAFDDTGSPKNISKA